MRLIEVLVKDIRTDWLVWETNKKEVRQIEEEIDTVYEQVIVKDSLTGRELVLTKRIYEKPQASSGYNPCYLSREAEYIALLC